jgi:hypothetical protein
MTKSDKHEFPITPSECLAQLPEIPLNIVENDSDDGLRRAELRHSVLAIADLNHVTETALVRAVVKNALGKLPDFEG